MPVAVRQCEGFWWLSMLLALCGKHHSPLLPTYSPSNTVVPAELPSAAFCFWLRQSRMQLVQVHLRG